MRNPHGYIKVTEGVPHKGGDVWGEADTFQCSHCGKHVMVKAKASLDALGNMCRGCMQMICPACVNRTTTVIEIYGQRVELQGCVTWERNMEIQEARARLHRAATRG